MENPNIENTEETGNIPATGTMLYLNYYCGQGLRLISNEIMRVLEGENDLTKEETMFWIDRMNLLLDIGLKDLQSVKAKVDEYERQQAISALVPFVNNAHLN